jgi:hypothetical protein
MLRRSSAIVAGFLINLLVISSFVLSTPTPAAACPDEPPKTLLQLYRSSDAIYIARFAGLEKGKLLRKEDNFEVFRKTRRFEIESELKGASREHFVLDEEDWVYMGASVADEPEGSYDEEEGMDAPEVVKGDRILLFLREDEEDGQKLVLADYRDGIKKLSKEAFPVYIKRIKELKSIFGKEEPSDERIVDWLVDVAEDPVTRWEGAFELLQAVETLEWREQEAKAEKERSVGSSDGPEEQEGAIEVVEGSVPEEVVEEEEHDMGADNSAYAKALNGGHKQRLSNILVNMQKSDAGTDAAPVRGDMELINLVHRWGDSHLAEALLSRLAPGGEAAWDNSNIMSAIAKLLGDPKLKKFSEEYSEIAWGEDDAEVDGNEAAVAVGSPLPETSTPAADTSTGSTKLEEDVKIEQTASDASIPPAAEPLRADLAKDPALDPKTKQGNRRITFGQKRAELMSSFLSRAIVLFEQKRTGVEIGLY